MRTKSQLAGGQLVAQGCLLGTGSPALRWRGWELAQQAPEGLSVEIIVFPIISPFPAG